MSSGKIAAVILAAGKGVRMNSAIPKVMHPLAGRPMIAHVVAALAPLAPDPLVVVVGPDMDEIATAVPSAHIAVQRDQRGTGDAVKAALPALDRVEGDVLIVFGDSPLIGTETMRQMLEVRHRAPEPTVVVLGFRPDDTQQYGRLIVAPDGGLDAIVEHRDADAEQRKVTLCNSGVMAVDGARLPALLDALRDDNEKGEFYLTDIVGAARADGAPCAYVEAPAEDLMGINSRAELADAEAAMQRRLRTAMLAAGVALVDPQTVYLSHDTEIGRDTVVEPHVIFGPGVRVGERAVIKGFSHIEGTTIADGARVGPYARLRPGTEIGADAHVGNFVEVKNAVLAAGAKANHLSYIGDASVGERSNIGAGTITCNYDGFLKSRTEIGEGVFIGSNTALVAPVSIGDGAIVGAGSTVDRDVEANAMAVARPKIVLRSGSAESFRNRKRAMKEGRQKKPDGKA